MNLIMRSRETRSSVVAAVLRFTLARSRLVACALACALAASCGSSGGGGQATPSDDGGSSSSGSSSSGSSSGSSGSSSGSTASSSGGSSSGSTGSSSGGTDAGSGGDAATPADSGAGDASAPGGRQVLVWVPTYLNNFSQNIMAVTTTTPKAFTEVSPDFYTMTTSGTPTISGTTFDGMSIAQVATQVHGAGMKLIPLIYGGNTDYGTFLGDSNAQSTFITWLVTEAQTNAYDGWNIDWEPNSINSMEYVSFLTAAKAALHAQNLLLTVDIGGWYIEQCGADGIDLTQIGPAVDVAIIEDYAGGEGTAPTTCTGAPTGMVNCDPDPTNYFGAQLGLMCDISPVSAVSIGLIDGSGGTGANPFLPQALTDIAAIGFTQVAVWPDEDPFLVPTNIPNGGTWYSNLAQFLAQ
jgi:hypothetical protein